MTIQTKPSTMVGDGQLQHHAWGKYHATIVLVFISPEVAAKAMEKLSPGWKVHPKNSRAITWHGDEDKLKPIQEELIGYGADKQKMNSMAKSIDYGERFIIRIPE